MGCMLIQIITCVIAAISLIIAILSYQTAKDANGISKQSLLKADSANTIANEANKISRDANAISERSLRVSEDHVTYNWRVECDDSGATARVVNDSPHDASDVIINMRIDNNPVIEAHHRDCVAAFEQISFKTPLAADRVANKVVTGEGCVFIAEVKITTYVTWRTIAGLRRSECIQTSL